MARNWKDDKDDRRNADDERQRMSWSEIDKRRNRSRHVDADPKPAGPRRTKATAAYSKYKTELNRLFNSGDISSKLADRMGDQATISAEAAGLKPIRKAEGRDFEKQIMEYFQSHGSLPEDPAILAKSAALADTAIVKHALALLLKIGPDMKIPGRASLLERLNTLLITSHDPDLTILVEKFRKSVGL